MNNNEKFRSYPVVWCEGKAIFEFQTTRHRRLFNKLMFGICGYSKRIWYLSKLDIHTMVIQTISIVDGECLDGDWCLDFDCEYNKTTEASFRKGVGLGKGKLPANFGATMPLNKKEDGSLRDYAEIINNHQGGTFILAKKIIKQPMLGG